MQPRATVEPTVDDPEPLPNISVYTCKRNSATREKGNIGIMYLVIFSITVDPRGSTIYRQSL
jgi:hypothetical protein